MTTSEETDLTIGLMRRLDQAGVGRYSDTAGDVFGVGEAAIVAKELPPKPDRLVSISLYLVNLDPRLPTVEYRAQARSRGHPHHRFDGDDLGGLVVSVLHGIRHEWWGGVEVSECVHFSSLSFPRPDESGRWERTDNFTITSQRRKALS